MMRWQPVIGIEIHAQLKTRSKLFSGAATRYGAAPNAQACGIDVALPGTLPVLNVAVVRMAVAFGLSINGEINLRSVFERKNYFYRICPRVIKSASFTCRSCRVGRHYCLGTDSGKKNRHYEGTS